MTEIMIMKTLGGALVPCDPQAAEFIQKLKVGAGVRAKVSKARNTFFHRKFFALLNHAFDAWEPVQKEYKGVAIQKNFDQFENSLFPASAGYSKVRSELGDIARKSGIRLEDLSFRQSEISSRGMTQVTMDAAVVGDYKSVIQFLNGVQRSPNLYEVDALVLATEKRLIRDIVALSVRQSGAKSGPRRVKA